MPITDQFVQHGMLNPDHPAIDFGAVRCSYTQLLSTVQLVASAIGMHSRSPRRSRAFPFQNPCVALLIPNRVEFLELFLGTALAGGVAMVLNPDWPVVQLEQMLTRWTPDILIAEVAVLATVVDYCPGSQAIALDPPDPCPFLDYQRWISTASNTLQDIQPSDTSPFYIGFTSGTTGTPKGVLRNHGSWVASFQAGQIEFGFEEDDQILVPGALVHSLSLYSAVETLVHGATLHSLPAFTPKAVLQRCCDYPITRLVAVPTLLRAIARAASHTSVPFPTVRLVISGGSKLSPSLRNQLHIIFPNARIMDYYGASELSFITLASSAEPVPPHSVGRPFHGVDLSVRQDDGMAAPPGGIGWIGVRSAMICAGYLGETDGTGFRIEQGWATVGDRGWLDDAGYLFLAGRERDMLICNGINVYPAEIETVLLNHPAIDDAVVVGVPDDCRGDRLCAVIKPTLPSPQSEMLNRAALIHYLQTHLEPAKCPRHFFIVDQFPLTMSSKINRIAVQKHLLDGTLPCEALM